MLSDTALRGRQAAAWVTVALFVVGFFWGPLGQVTTTLLGLWFVGTQKPLRGFFWLLALALLPHLVQLWSTFRPASASQWAAYCGWIAVASLISVLPFNFHRLTSRSLPGVLWTLPFPLAYACVQTAAPFLLPSAGVDFLARDPHAALYILNIAHFTGVNPTLFRFSGILLAAQWPIAALLWLWNRELRAWRFIRGVAAIAAVLCLIRILNTYCARNLFDTPDFFYSSCIGLLAIALWALVPSLRQKALDSNLESTGILQSPATGEPLQLAEERGGMWNRGGANLVSASGEHFPIRDGIAQLLRPNDLTGLNKKYNHLYETIGGFYDDTQRVGCALMGMDRDAYVMRYLGLLEVKPGDRVLETSVGTGLNFKYLPRGVELHGLDLSRQMLINCRENLRRWKLNGTLVLGNAELLPYADESFDVVFHVGGINFFSDRAAAIAEMIRVAKPGTRILIADETEEHVKASYENIPYTREFFKDRDEAVAAPVDLVPAEMQEMRVESLTVAGKKRFYALTFRKPGSECARKEAVLHRSLVSG
jgi:ubiquinone/menaquinone biosynthesis C-methylase UbiE